MGTFCCSKVKRALDCSERSVLKTGRFCDHFQTKKSNSYKGLGEEHLQLQVWRKLCIFYLALLLHL